MPDIQWRRVNSEPFEYAIAKGMLGDEFVKADDGTCLRRPLSGKEKYIKCPFCGFGDFDLVGLKLHYLRGHCDVFNDVTE